MPVSVKSKGSFTISAVEETEGELVQTKDNRVHVIWSCGEERIFTREQIDRAVKFFARRSRTDNECLLIYEIPYPHHKNTQPTDFSVIRLIGEDMHILREGLTLNWPSFVKAWKEVSA